MKKYILLFLIVCFWSCGEQNQDDIPPEITITYPNSNVTVTDSITINAIANDNEQVAFVELFINGYNSGLKDYSEPFQFNWVTWDSANGNYSIFLRAHDNSDNQGISEILDINVNNTFSGNIVGYVSGTSSGSSGFSWHHTSNVCFDNDTRHDGVIDSFSLKICPDNEITIGPFEINRIINSEQTICEQTSFTTDNNCGAPVPEVINIVWTY